MSQPAVAMSEDGASFPCSSLTWRLRNVEPAEQKDATEHPLAVDGALVLERRSLLDDVQTDGGGELTQGEDCSLLVSLC